MSIGRLATQIAHELNNVLMGIQPFVDLLKKRLAGDPDTQRSLSSISTAVKRGSGITHGVLKYARPVPPKLRDVDIRAWMENVHAELAGICGPGLVPQTIFETEGTVSLDPEQMDQVIVNLGTNARDAMQGSANDRSLTLTVRDGRPGGLEILVSDTGVGIAVRDMQYLFEPMFTTKQTGTGLGLAISHQIVGAHGGTIEVESQPGQGATFKVSLPYARMASPSGQNTYTESSVPDPDRW